MHPALAAINPALAGGVVPLGSLQQAAAGAQPAGGAAGAAGGAAPSGAPGAVAGGVAQFQMARASSGGGPVALPAAQLPGLATLAQAQAQLQAQLQRQALFYPVVPQGSMAQVVASPARPRAGGARTGGGSRGGGGGGAAAAKRHCNCKNSRCLKLYCECFASGRYCDGCNCLNCHNNSAHESTRQAAVESILERNPNAFRPKIAGHVVRGAVAGVCARLRLLGVQQGAPTAARAWVVCHEGAQAGGFSA